MLTGNMFRLVRPLLTRRTLGCRGASTTSARTFDHDVKDILGYHGARIALRDACRCPKCVDQASKQRDFKFADIPTNIDGEVGKEADGTYTVKWIGDIPGYEDHVSTYSAADVERVKNLPRQSHHTTTMVWDKSIFEKESGPISYEYFMNEEEGLARVLYFLVRHGLVFLTGVPKEDASVSTVAQRIAQLRNSFYGQTWNVRSVPQAINVAYTSKYLGFHSDLCYMKEIPGFQFLHCLENTCPGGESRFVDTLKAYDVLCTESPELAESLRNTAVRYEYDNDGQYYTDVKPVIREKTPFEVPNRTVKGNLSPALQRVSRVYWSPPFVGSIWPVPGEDAGMTEKKIKASKAFADILERPEFVYEEKMDAGTCVIFNNYRVLHARNAFDMNSGKRWLKGCYLDEQDVLSRELSLSAKIRDLDKSFD